MDSVGTAVAEVLRGVSVTIILPKPESFKRGDQGSYSVALQMALGQMGASSSDAYHRVPSQPLDGLVLAEATLMPELLSLVSLKTTVLVGVKNCAELVDDPNGVEPDLTVRGTLTSFPNLSRFAGFQDQLFGELVRGMFQRLAS